MVEVKQLANIASNAAAPVMGQSLALGTVEYVLLEAAVSMLLRRVIKAPRRSFLQEVALHTISLPFLGGPLREDPVLRLLHPAGHRRE